MRVNLKKLRPVGSYPSVEEKVTLQLAREYQRIEGFGYVTSWANQEKAQDFFNEHGFEKTLSHMLSLRVQNQ